MNIGNLFKFNKIQEPKTSTSEIVDYHGKTLEDKSKVIDPILPFFTPFVFNEYLRAPKKNLAFVYPEYDLNTVANALQLDGLLQRIVHIYVEQIMKNGYEFVSKDIKAQLYIRRRIKEIEQFTSIRINEVFTMVSNQLVSYGNAYVIKVRGDMSSIAKNYTLFSKKVKPIVGLFVADATTISFEVDENSRVINYIQRVKGQMATFSADDVIHLTYNKIPGCYTGLTPIISVLDDVRALRKLEEEIEILGFQYAIPLYMYKIGSDTHPAQQGEIDAARTSINNMPTYGIMCVPHTHSMESIKGGEAPVDIMQYVEHFKHRIYSGTGVSPIAMGEANSSNRNTAESLDISMQNITKSYQQIIKNNFEQEFLLELLLEGRFNLDQVSCDVKFPEIDLEAQIKFETNEIQKYLNGLITRSESRLALDYDIAIDDSDTYLRLDKIPLAEATAAAKASFGPAPAAKKNASLSRPTNKHGTTSGRPKIKKDALDTLISSSKELYDVLLGSEGYKSKLNRDKTMVKLTSNITNFVPTYLKETIDSYIDYYQLNIDIKVDQEISDEITRYILVKVNHKMDRFSLDTSDYKYQFNSDSIIRDFDVSDKMDNLAKILILTNLGVKTILYKSDDCELHSNKVVEINDISFSNIPPLRYNCKCRVDFSSIEGLDDGEEDQH